MLIFEFLQYLNFVASTIAITFFHPAPKKLPFKTFDEMADAVLDGDIRLVGIKNAATARFTSPSLALANSDPTLMKFYQANLQDRVAAVPTMDDAFNMIRKEENRAFIVNILSAQANADLCDFEIIEDLTFPKIPYGFFYSNLSTDWFYQDPALMGQLGEFFQHYVKHYTFPTRCINMRPRQGLNINQVETTFYMLAAGLFFGFLGFIWELFHKTPAQKEFELKQQLGKLVNKPKIVRTKEIPEQFIKDYFVKHIVDGGYNQSDEVWICVQRKSDDMKSME